VLTELVREAVVPGGSLPLAVSYTQVMHGAELGARLGVLVSLVGVLINLHPVPPPQGPQTRRRKNT